MRTRQPDNNENHDNPATTPHQYHLKNINFFDYLKNK